MCYIFYMAAVPPMTENYDLHVGRAYCYIGIPTT